MVSSCTVPTAGVKSSMEVVIVVVVVVVEGVVVVAVAIAAAVVVVFMVVVVVHYTGSSCTWYWYATIVQRMIRSITITRSSCACPYTMPRQRFRAPTQRCLFDYHTRVSAFLFFRFPPSMIPPSNSLPQVDLMVQALEAKGERPLVVIAEKYIDRVGDTADPT